MSIVETLREAREEVNRIPRLNDLVPMEDQYEVAKARLELNVTRVHLNRFLSGFITRITDHRGS